MNKISKATLLATSLLVSATLVAFQPSAVSAATDTTLSSTITYNSQAPANLSYETTTYNSTLFDESAPNTFAGYDYSDVFDQEYYAAHNPDVAAVFGDSAENMLWHFVTYGMSEGRQAKESFNVVKYMYALGNSDLHNTFGGDIKQYYLHYIDFGQYEGRSVSDYDAVFDADYYLQQNPDVLQNIISRYTSDGNLNGWALWHYCEYGMDEGRRGTSSFGVYNYLAANYDIYKTYGSDTKAATQHYLQYGIHEGRNTMPDIDIYTIPQIRADVVAALGNDPDIWVSWYISEHYDTSNSNNNNHHNNDNLNGLTLVYPTVGPNQNMPVISQYDSAIANYPYGPTTILDGGCGVCAFAMVASFLDGQVYSPIQIVDTLDKLAAENGMGWEYYYLKDVGSYHSIFPHLSNYYTYNIKDYSGTMEQAIKEQLDMGHVVITSISRTDNSIYQGYGHFIVIRGYDSNTGKFYINDSNNPAGKQHYNENTLYSYEQLGTVKSARAIWK